MKMGGMLKWMPPTQRNPNFHPQTNEKKKKGKKRSFFFYLASYFILFISITYTPATLIYFVLS
eukprot:m.32454 g.32454  ORF g.32454 m.32454 type:complete len:63 (-) comp6385_c0_seq1:1827-2015(-)